MHMYTCPWSSLLGRRILWLNIQGKEAAVWSMFHISTPLPQVSGCVVAGQVLTVPWSSWGVPAYNPGSLRSGDGDRRQQQRPLYESLRLCCCAYRRLAGF